MSPTVELSQQTFSRLQKYAVPLIDDIQTVINRLADFYDTHGGKGNGSTQPLAQLFNPASPPDLTHTRVLSIKFAGTELGHVQHNWNRLLDQAIGVAFALLKDAKKVTALLHINSVVGKKEDQGYRFLSHSGISCRARTPTAHGGLSTVSPRSSASPSTWSSCGLRRKAWHMLVKPDVFYLTRHFGILHPINRGSSFCRGFS